MNRPLKVFGLLVIGIGIIIAVMNAIMKYNTRQYSPTAEVIYNHNDLSLKIEYCQPYKKGRLIFGDDTEGALQPFGDYWRLGANDATTIELNRDVMFNDKHLAKGTYSMYAIPGKKSWTIGINSVANRWGYAEPNYDKDVLQTEVPVSYNAKSLEQFKITIVETESGATLQFKWDTAEVNIPIR